VPEFIWAIFIIFVAPHELGSIALTY